MTGRAEGRGSDDRATGSVLGLSLWSTYLIKLVTKRSFRLNAAAVPDDTGTVADS
jgi:hypothetical protein